MTRKSDSAPWWTKTWSPLIGCAHCWAERFARRHAANHTLPPATRQAYQDVAARDGTIRLLPHMLDMPLRWRKPQIVLACAMTDLFHPQTKSDWMGQILEIMALHAQHQFVILTKRPERAMVWTRNGLPPRPNIWLGASMCDQHDADRMLPPLCKLAERGWNTFIHAEPLVRPVSLTAAYDDWWKSARAPRWMVIAGENGPGARLTNPEWVRALARAMRDAGIPIWFKGWGRHIPEGQQPGKLDGIEYRQTPEEWKRG